MRTYTIQTYAYEHDHSPRLELSTADRDEAYNYKSIWGSCYRLVIFTWENGQVIHTDYRYR